MMSREQEIIGCLLGTACGDALGLPYEGLTRGRQKRLFSDVRHYHLLFGWGMVSDDTQHTLMVAQAVVVSKGNEREFCRAFAWQLRRWLLGVPAGVGLATLRATLKLWLGFGPARSGVFSAGNGPAMRSAILGVCYPQDVVKRQALVQLSARLTHTDPKAEQGAQAIALAASLACGKIAPTPAQFLTALEREAKPEAGEFVALIRRAVQSAEAGESSEEFAQTTGLHRGISGYVLHTVPVTLQTWLRHQDDWIGGVEEIIRCGGDTDTTAAIVGALIGARVGKSGLQPVLLSRLWEWPQDIAWMERLGRRLAETLDAEGPGHPLPSWGSLPRNLLFLGVVLAHGFRRLLPPYEIKERL